MVTYKEIKENEAIKTYITCADESLKALGFTEHSFAHVTKVAENAAYVLRTLGYPERDIELAKIAGYLHDIGNLVNRIDHSQSGAIMAFRILDKLDMPASDLAKIVTAIGNHDEGTGVAVNPVSAALILADTVNTLRITLSIFIYLTHLFVKKNTHLRDIFVRFSVTVQPVLCIYCLCPTKCFRAV